MAYVSSNTLELGRRWIALDVEASGLVWGNNHLRGCHWRTRFRRVLDHNAIDSIGSGDHNTQVHRWPKYPHHIELYTPLPKGGAIVKAKFLSPLPQRAIEHDRRRQQRVTSVDREKISSRLVACALKQRCLC